LGQGFAYLLIGFGIFLLVADSDAVNGLWFMVLGWFLGQAARSAVVTSRFTERLEGVTVADVMDTQPVWVPGDEPAARVEDEFFARYRSPWFPVADPTSGRFHGIVTAERVDAAIAGGQPEAPARDLVEPAPHEAERAVSVRPDSPVEHLLGSEPLRARGALMVVDADGRLTGVVTLDQVRRALTAATSGRLT
jgi:CBS domain-containing protein